MRQVMSDKGTVRVQTVDSPQLERGMVLVQVHYSCISAGTESATLANAAAPLTANISQKVKKVMQAWAEHGTAGTYALIKGKLAGTYQALGYAASGQVLAVAAGVRGIAVGDWVACAGSGYAHHADLVVVPEHLVVRLSNQAVVKQASLTTLGAIALQGVRQARVSLGETVAVVGLGLLGQLTVQLLARAGCRVIGIDMMPERVELALQHGASFAWCADVPSLESDIAFATAHYGVDATLITAASAAPLVDQAARITRRKGRIVIVGDVPITATRDAMYQKELELVVSCSYGPGRYDAAYEREGQDYPYGYVRWTLNRNMQAVVSLIESGSLRLDSFIAHEFEVENAQAAYQLLSSKRALSALLHYQQGVVKPSIVAGTRTASTPIDDVIRIGFVGVGGFAKTKLLPLITSQPKVQLTAFVDTDMANAQTVARQYHVDKVYSSLATICQSDSVDALIIASPHSYHAAQVIDALLTDKAVFVEKPLAITQAQLDAVRACLHQQENARLAVDFNRSFAPLIKHIKQALHGRTTPLCIAYRMNAGYIPADHWIQTDIGGGRIIGEACHIIDLFYELTQSYPVSIAVETVRSSSADVGPTDNATMIVRFADGSVCTLVYTALGNSTLSKERMELFWQGKSIVMDDYQELKGYGLPASFDQTSRTADKGHHELISQFIVQVRAPQFEPPIDYERLLSVTQVCLYLDELARQGGGRLTL